MKRGALNWSLLLCCALLILGAMGWMTYSVLQSEKDRLTAEAQADLEERKRTAIARMDALTSSFLLIENQRPPAHYRALQKADGKDRVSPILMEEIPLAKLYFELNAVAALTSPQVPQGNAREMAIKQGVSQEKLKAYQEAMVTLSKLLVKKSQSDGQDDITPLKLMCRMVDEVQTNWNKDVDFPEARKEASELQKKVLSTKPLMVQKQRSKQSKEARAATYKLANQQVVENTLSSQKITWGANETEERLISMDSFAPVWMDGELAVARQVKTDRETRVQGIWLNLDVLKAELLATTRDLFSSGRLEKVALPSVGLEDLMEQRLKEASADPDVLVSLPFRFDCNEVAEVVVPFWSPLKKSLLIGWAAAAMALLAVLMLVRGIMKLSERRAAFVSSVTHELRTPLTTFRLYSEMLADGMVKDKEKQQEYLRTMLGESERLNHLVENVLAYSRIEKGSARRKKERLTLEAFLDQLGPLIERRVTQEGAVLKMDNQVSEREVEIDVTSVEQIIFNLVDNACKYGMPDDGIGEVHLNIAEKGGKLIFTISDSGKGIARWEQKRLFRAFHKSAQDAAETKPGVGLGLALCRRLARAMGGELELQKGREHGAGFVLSLPV